MGFIDFKKAFDSIHHETLWKILRHYGLPQKIVGLISILHKSFECSVLMDSTQTDYFPVKSGVRQGCILSPILFNITLDYIMRQTTQNARHGIQWTMFSQLEDRDYAEDTIALLSTNARHLQQKANVLNENAKKARLHINIKKIEAPNDTAYKRWSCHSGLKLLCKLCRTSPPPAMGVRFTVFWACRPCGPAGWLALLLSKAGDVETNPGPTTLNKKVWICDICHKQIHVRKQISIRCNRIEHWVHLRCAGIRQAQYTDTWTCHLHRESRLTPHTDITPPHRSRPLSKPPTHSPPTPPQPKHTHVQHSPLSTHTGPSQTHTHVTHSTNTSHKHVTCTRQNT